MMRLLKNVAFRAAVYASRAKVDNTIIVAGAPRSGTTWLAELLRELPKYKFLNEPLFLKNNPTARSAGFAWRTHLSPEEENKTAEAFFRNILSGDVSRGPLWHYESNSSLGRLAEHVQNPSLVIKFCRAGRLLHWLLKTFDVRGAAMLIRHPCAVLASQLAHGGWTSDQLEHDVSSKDAVGQMPENVRNRFANIFEAISTRLDLMTVRWCLDYYIPLIEYADYGHPWVLVPYERLVLDGEREMKRVLSSLNANMTDAIRTRLSVSSMYASSDLSTTDKQKQLEKWQSRLSEKQIGRILDIVSAFDLDFYTTAPEPDYERLYRKEDGIPK